MNRTVRRWLPWTILAALVAGLWIGWIVLRRVVEDWVTAEHRVGEWVVHPHGRRILSWDGIVLDSMTVTGPGAGIRVRAIGLSWFRRIAIPVHRFPFLIDLSVGDVDVRIDPDAARSKKDSTSRSTFPASLRIPVAFHLRVDSLRVRRDTSLDLRTSGIVLETQGPSGIALEWSRLRQSSIPAILDGTIRLDWGKDSLRGDIRTLLSSGDRARDTLTASVVADFGDLTAGRAQLHAAVEDLANWSTILPVLAKTPSARRIRVDLDAWRVRAGKPSLDLRLALESGTVLFAPDLGWNIRVRTDSTASRVEVAARGDAAAALDIDLSATGDLDSAIRLDRFSGSARVRGLGYLLAQQPHPFDGDIEVKSIGMKGGTGTVKFVSGSVVEGGAVWKGLHWYFKAVVAKDEPWALGWVPGILLGEGSRVTGRDTVGAALFHVLAKQPGYNWFRGDSAMVDLRLDLHEIRFARIRLWNGIHSWSGDGRVGWTLPGYSFALAADSGAGRASVEGDFLGKVEARAEGFSTLGLPVVDRRFAPPFPIVVDARFIRLPPRPSRPDSMGLVGFLRAQPDRDSLRVAVEASMEGDRARITNLHVERGSGIVDGNLEVFRKGLDWKLDSADARLVDVDLERFMSLWPGLPTVRGSANGHAAIARGSGVSADIRVAGLAVQAKDDWTILPDLRIWGARDTLSIGGYWPVAEWNDPFRLTIDGLFEPSPSLRLLAFHGDVVRVTASGVLENRQHLKASLVAEGGLAIPRTEARLDGLLVEGTLDASRSPDGVVWSAALEGKEGVLRALRGMPLQAKFRVRATPENLFVDTLTLRGANAGLLEFHGRYGLASGLYAGAGRAREFHLDLGEGKMFHVGTMDIEAGEDQRIRAKFANVSWSQRWGDKGGLWVDVDRAQLALVQAKDWRKLQGQIQVNKLLYTREIADPKSLLISAGNSLSGQDRESSGNEIRKDGIPLLLDLRIWGGGDSVRVANNLAEASLTFDLQATGPADALLLNGTIDADPQDASFGYLGKRFQLQEFHTEWNSAPPLNGRYTLEGTRSILAACPDAVDAQDHASNLSATAGSCNLKLSSEGTLSDPRLHPLTSDCGAGGADEGAVEAAVALARDCYPQEIGSGSSTLGTSARSAIFDLGVQQGMGLLNNAIRRQLLEQRAGGRIFLPDSIALTDVPLGGSRDQLGLLALYRLSDEVDAEGEYRHTFAQTATSTSTVGNLSDDYSLRLRWRPPLAWIEEKRIKERLKDHLVFQVEVGQALDDRAQRETTIRPSIRYRWEFW